MERGHGKGRVVFLNGVEKCAEFDHQTRLCKSYEQRPVLCRMFPFFSSANLNELIISPSLACPHVTEEEPFFDLRDFEKMLWENNMVQDIYDRYIKATSMYQESKRELQAPFRAIIFIKKVLLYPPSLERIRKIFKEEFKALASNPNALESIVKSINHKIFEACRYEPENYRQRYIEEIGKLPYPSRERIIELLFERQRTIINSYITPASSSSNPTLMQYYRKGKRLFFKDAFSGEKWELKIEECLKPLELDKKAREILSDYLDLLLERNYLIQSRAYPTENMLQRYISFLTSLAQMLIAALSTVASRREAAEISEDITREALAMTDARACITIYW